MSRLVALALALCFVAPARAQRDPPRVFSLAAVIDVTEEQELRWPVAVAAASADLLGVADLFGSRLLLFRRVGVSWSLERSVELPAPPAGLAWSGERWVLSLRGRSQLLTLAESGEVVGAIELPAQATPGYLAEAPAEGLLVWDAGGAQVLRIDRNGRVFGSVPVDGHATGLAADGSGGFVISEGDRGRLLRFDASGRLATSWDLPTDRPRPAWPTGVVVEPGGRTVVADRQGGRILVLDASGQWVGMGSRRGEEPGLLRYPAELARLPDGSLLVADQGNGRVQIFRPTSRGGGS